MEGWNKVQASFANLNLGQSASKFAKGFNSSVQATKELKAPLTPLNGKNPLGGDPLKAHGAGTPAV